MLGLAAGMLEALEGGAVSRRSPGRRARSCRASPTSSRSSSSSRTSTGRRSRSSTSSSTSRTGSARRSSSSASPGPSCSTRAPGGAGARPLDGDRARAALRGGERAPRREARRPARGRVRRGAAALPKELLERAEGNPLFVEETIRMLVEGGSGTAAGRVPDTLQALIAARIDHLPPAAKTLLQRASVVGRVFWKGAIEHFARHRGQRALLDDLLLREFLLREPRSSISGETAYRFKHLLIREVAYAGLAKLARAQHHARFAEWLAERTGEELVEIRAYHLDQAVEFLTELEGAPPEELAEDDRTRSSRPPNERSRVRRTRLREAGPACARASADARGAIRRSAERRGGCRTGPRSARDGKGPRSGARARRARDRGPRADRARRGDAQARR